MKFKSLSLKIVVIALAVAALFFITSCWRTSSNKIVDVDDLNFEEIVLNNEKPVLLFFYWNKKGSMYKHLYSTMNKINEIVENEVVFARYCMKDGEIDEEYEVKNDAVCILFEDGESIERQGISNLRKDPALGPAQLYLVLEEIMEPYLDLSALDNEPEFLTEETFEEYVIDAEKPVLINFTDSDTSCGIVHASARRFTDAASTYGGYSDFYFIDVKDPGALDLMAEYRIRQIPSTLSFYRGKMKHNQTATYKSPYKEVQLFGMILPYINTEP
ncbi:MAG: thioredoxin family protein [Proteobacteria bacterium]|nr:thioredoxin family protein [Pseudomonadota bacterium]